MDRQTRENVQGRRKGWSVEERRERVFGGVSTSRQPTSDCRASSTDVRGGEFTFRDYPPFSFPFGLSRSVSSSVLATRIYRLRPSSELQLAFQSFICGEGMTHKLNIDDGLSPPSPSELVHSKNSLVRARGGLL